MNRADRDLLIELKTKMDGLVSSIKEMGDSLAIRVSDHEIRLRFIERYVWLALGALAVITLAINFFK